LTFAAKVLSVPNANSLSFVGVRCCSLPFADFRAYLVTKRSTAVYCPVIRLTRREQLFILALFLAIFIGAVVKHFREGAPRIPAALESTE
jgi:hypothetical protein